MTWWLRLLQRWRKFTEPPADVIILPPRYASRETGESFGRYDPAMQERARQRREAADAMRAKASRMETGAAAPIREARRA